MKTAVVILNWNTEAHLRRFLPGVLKACPDVIVADNGSTDGSREYLAGLDVPTILLDRNYGFTGGYNRALEGLDAEYYVLLNSDVETPEGWLEPLERWMDAHPECAACGPKLHKIDERDEFEYAGAAGGFVDRYGFPFCRGRVLSKTEKDRGQYDGAPAEVLWVSGACLMVRSSVWRELGGLDDRFFAHMEEIDFCWRAARAGFSVVCVPDSTVYHLGGGTLPQGSPFKLRLNYRNNLLMLRANLPSRRVFCVRYCMDILAACAYLLMLRPRDAKAVFKAHAEYRALKGPRPPKGTKIPAGYRKNEFLLLKKICG